MLSLPNLYLLGEWVSGVGEGYSHTAIRGTSTCQFFGVFLLMLKNVFWHVPVQAHHLSNDLDVQSGDPSVHFRPILVVDRDGPP
jgi:hypothetical protein